MNRQRQTRQRHRDMNTHKDTYTSIHTHTYIHADRHTRTREEAETDEEEFSYSYWKWKLMQSLWKWRVLPKTTLKIELPYGPAVVLLACTEKDPESAHRRDTGTSCLLLHCSHSHLLKSTCQSASR